MENKERKLEPFKTNVRLVYIENERFLSDGETASAKELRKRNYPEIKASVPGNALRDMVNAGVAEEPYFGKNCLAEKYDNLHLFYINEFECDVNFENPVLVFEGIDTVSDIYLNGKHIGSTDNMFIEYEFTVSDFIKSGKNEIVVHVKPYCIEARKYPAALNESAQKYNYGSLYIRKAAHSLGWDIFPRLTLGGIWRDVFVEERKRERIKQAYCYTNRIDACNKTADLCCFFETEIAADDIKRYSICIRGRCKESSFEKCERLWHTSGKISFTLTDAQLWWPRNYGEANLYDVSITLLKDGDEIDCRREKVGVRTVELSRTSVTDEAGNGDFCFIINKKRIFCMGTNWVSVDALHADCGKRISKAMPYLVGLGCNMLRVWGGGVYETDEFYGFCDENGIMVWQDFMMGCAIYPQTDEFAKKIEEEAEFIVKRLRQHPSIVLWAGDNEGDIAYLGWYDKRRNPNENRLTREVIPRVLRTHDFLRPYIPSSPYVDGTAYTSDYKFMSEDHIWGPRDYFKGEYYSSPLCHFVSETGYHGCPSPKSLEKFIPKENLFTATDKNGWRGIENNGEWLAHAASPEEDLSAPYAYRLRLMADQVTTLFGKSVPLSLGDFAKASQISQAEALKFFIERVRISKGRTTGILWWNLIDGWPQISDAVIDYYFTEKLAYHYIKRSQNPICIMIGEPDEDGKKTVFAVNDTVNDAMISYKITDFESGEILCGGECMLEGDSIKKLNLIPQGKTRRFILIEWNRSGKIHKNHYVETIKDLDYQKYKDFIEKAGFSDFEGF